MREQDIRPKGLEKKYDELFRKDLERFFGGFKNFIKVNCPACDSINYEVEFEKKSFKFCRCGSCRTLFINPRPSQKQLADFYSTAKSVIYWSKYVFPASEEVRMKNIFAPRAKLIKKIVKSFYPSEISLVLDVGAGYGSFLEAARKLNLAQNYLAIEPAKESAKKCRDRGFEVMEKMIEDIVLSKKADLVVNFELIEHLFNPRLFIKSCHKLLKRGGLFIVTTPNILGFDLVILGKKSDNLAGPAHLNYFNLKSLSRLLVKEGFEILECLTPGELDVDIIKNKIISGKIKEDDLPFWGRAIKEDVDGFNNKLQEFLKNNRLSSNLMIVARKK
ncbi:MAG: class I SAM-dependent methyltransferase [bacterium]|nr:class I SAM-dependent methyltransferase [bacterium]